MKPPSVCTRHFTRCRRTEMKSHYSILHYNERCVSLQTRCTYPQLSYKADAILLTFHELRMKFDELLHTLPKIRKVDLYVLPPVSVCKQTKTSAAPDSPASAILRKFPVGPRPAYHEKRDRQHSCSTTDHAVDHGITDSSRPYYHRILPNDF